MTLLWLSTALALDVAVIQVAPPAQGPSVADHLQTVYAGTDLTFTGFVGNLDQLEHTDLIPYDLVMVVGSDDELDTMSFFDEVDLYAILYGGNVLVANDLLADPGYFVFSLPLEFASGAPATVLAAGTTVARSDTPALISAFSPNLVLNTRPRPTAAVYTTTSDGDVLFAVGHGMVHSFEGSNWSYLNLPRLYGTDHAADGFPLDIGGYDAIEAAIRYSATEPAPAVNTADGSTCSDLDLEFKGMQPGGRFAVITGEWDLAPSDPAIIPAGPCAGLELPFINGSVLLRAVLPANSSGGFNVSISPRGGCYTYIMALDIDRCLMSNVFSYSNFL